MLLGFGVLGLEEVRIRVAETVRASREPSPTSIAEIICATSNLKHSQVLGNLPYLHRYP